MSPDPPREDSGDDDSLRRFNGELIEGLMDDEEFFIIPDAPYELDMEVESEYSDSEEDDHQSSMGAAGTSVTGAHRTQQSQTAQPQEMEFMFQAGQGQGRGRYRLLIPFPTATVDTSSNPDNPDSERNSTAVEGNNQNQSDTGSSDSQQITASTSTLPQTVSSCSSTTNQSDEQLEKPSTSKVLQDPPEAVPKREIELTEEKVETIKEVMKKIVLPAASIPKWAAEIDDDIWRKKLNDSIEQSKSDI